LSADAYHLGLQGRIELRFSVRRKFVEARRQQTDRLLVMIEDGQRWAQQQRHLRAFRC